MQFVENGYQESLDVLRKYLKIFKVYGNVSNLSICTRFLFLDSKNRMQAWIVYKFRRGRKKDLKMDPPFKRNKEFHLQRAFSDLHVQNAIAKLVQLHRWDLK